MVRVPCLLAEDLFADEWYSVRVDLLPGQGCSLVSFILYKLRDVCSFGTFVPSGSARTTAFHRPRSIRPCLFFARQFRSRPFRYTVSSFFRTSYVAKSFFSSFCRRTLPGARLHRSYPGHGLRTRAPLRECLCVCQVCHSFLSDRRYLILITYLRLESYTTSPEVNHTIL